MNNKIAFIDIFTTQNDLFGKNNCPIQFSCQVYDETDIYDKGKFILNPDNSTTINIIPDEDISIAGYITSGINNETVKSGDYNGVEVKSALETIYNTLKTLQDEGCYIAGYNHIKYDLSVLNTNFARLLGKEPITFPEDKIIDIMRLSECIVPVTKCGNYTMDAVYLSFVNDISKLEGIRRVKSTLTDIKITKILMYSLLNVIRMSPKCKDKNFTCPEIVSIIKHLEGKVHRFNFGKYKGLTIDEVFQKDTQYISWVMKHSDKPYLVEKLRTMMDTQVQ